MQKKYTEIFHASELHTEIFRQRGAKNLSTQKSIRTETLICKIFSHSHVKLTEAPGSFKAETRLAHRIGCTSMFLGRNPLFCGQLYGK